MNIFKTLSLAAMALAFSSCSSAHAADYTLTIPVSEDEDGLTAYLVDYDSGAKIDSTVIADNAVTFKGSIERPVLAQLVIDGTRAGMLVLEQGNIVGNLQQRSFSGSGLNDALIEFGKKMGELQSAFRSLKNDSAGRAKAVQLQADYDRLMRSTLDANKSNPIGYYLFLQEAYEMDLAQLDKALTENPVMASSQRVKRLRENLLKKSETSVGKMYKDFTITQPDGTKKSLSDYVGKGNYTLVDFWASWCGPCIRETKVIKQLYEKYNGKGMDFLGVAVWDKPGDTLAAIKAHELPWQQIINAQTIPTDIYGISGIPCIILLDPQGRIVSRDKQDADLVADVEAAMAKYEQDINTYPIGTPVNNDDPSGVYRKDAGSTPVTE